MTTTELEADHVPCPVTVTPPPKFVEKLHVPAIWVVELLAAVTEPVKATTTGWPSTVVLTVPLRTPLEPTIPVPVPPAMVTETTPLTIEACTAAGLSVTVESFPLLLTVSVPLYVPA